MRRVSRCLLGSCGHDPYDVRCVDPDYTRQPCCGLRVHVDDVGSRDAGHHLDVCRVSAVRS